MPVAETDLVMVERSGALHKAEASEIAALGGGGAVGYSILGSFGVVDSAVDTVEQDILSFTVPANSLGTDKQMRVMFGARIHNLTGANATVRFRIYYGATKLYDDVTASIANSAQDRPLWAPLLLTAQGAVDAQDLTGQIAIDGLGAATTGRGDLGSDEISAHALLHGESAIDSTVDQTFRVAVVLSVANAEFWVRRYRCIAELIG